MPETVRKTFKEKLRPTPIQERALEEVLRRCRELYNAARNIHWRGQRLRGLVGMPAGMNREPVGL